MSATTVESLSAELRALKIEAGAAELEPWQQSAIANRIRQVQEALADKLAEDEN